MKLLIVEAHPDDAEWGCFAAAQQFDEVLVLCMTDGGQEGRVGEGMAGAGSLGFTFMVASENDSWVDIATSAAEISRVWQEFGAPMIWTHAADDGHQDHRAVANAVEIATRYKPVTVLAFDSPSCSGFVPNVIWPVTTEQLHRKIRALAKHRSQRSAPYMKPLVVSAHARWHGRYEEDGLAEPFRLVIRRGTPLLS